MAPILPDPQGNREPLRSCPSCRTESAHWLILTHAPSGPTGPGALGPRRPLSVCSMPIEGTSDSTATRPGATGLSVSIILPTLNERRFLRDCLDYAGVAEILVVDGGRTTALRTSPSSTGDAWCSWSTRRSPPRRT